MDNGTEAGHPMDNCKPLINYKKQNNQKCNCTCL